MANYHDAPGQTSIICSTADDVVYIDANNSITVYGLDGNDKLYGPSFNSTITVSSIESVIGGSANDTIINNQQSSSLNLTSIDTFSGSGSDIITLGDGGNNILVSGVSSIQGGVDGRNIVSLAQANQQLTINGIEQVIGSTGGDLVLLGSGGQTASMSSVESIIGGSGTDRVTLSDISNTVVIRNVETLVGGSRDDFVITGNRGATMSVQNIEVLLGGSSSDDVTIIGGATVTMAGIERLRGDSSGQMVLLGNRGVTTTVDGLETIVGGVGNDAVTLASTLGSTLLMAGVDTLIGSAGNDVVQLGNRGSTITVSGVETLLGGALSSRSDVVTVSSGEITFQGNAGADVLNLFSGVSEDQVVFSSSTDGAAAGSTSGFDSINTFQSGLDRVLITGSLLTTLDKNHNGSLTTRSLSSGQVNRSTDEVVLINTAISSLNDSNFQSFRAALGSVSGSSGEVLVIANDGTNTGLYSVGASSSGLVGASDVKLLAEINSSILAASNFGVL